MNRKQYPWKGGKDHKQGKAIKAEPIFFMDDFFTKQRNY
jgi:hypothetical protein